MADRASRSSFSSFLSNLVSEGGLRIDRDRAYGPDPRHMLDIYRAAGREQPNAPVVLFYYGGGWTAGDRATYTFVGSALAANGVTTVIADYRLFPQVRYPAFCEDAARAYAWVNATVADNGRRPVILMGHSAGAHIASLLTFDASYRQAAAPGLGAPSALIGLSGPYAFDPTTWPSTRTIFATAPSADKVRPSAWASVIKGPPTLLIHGNSDTVVEPVAAHTMEASLVKSKTPVRKIMYANIGHSALIMTFAQPLRWRAPLLEDVLKFVRGLA
jgi:acetyl esterase/lipase